MNDNYSIRDTLTSSINFQFYQRSRPIQLQLSKLSPLNDIFVRFFSQYDNMGRTPHDLRLYLNNIDTTEALRKLIISILQSDLVTQIKEDYSAALDNHLSVYPAINETPEEMKERAEELLNTPLENQFESYVGDFTYGWSGHLGLINFIYQEVGFPDISLREVVAEYNSNADNQIIIDELDILKIEFLHGRKGVKDPLPRGQFAFEIIVDRKNPLLLRLEAAEKRIEDLSSVVRGLAQRIDNVNGNIDILEARVNTIRDEVNTLSREFIDFSTETRRSIGAVESELSDIKKILDNRNNMIMMRKKDGRETIRIDGEAGDIRFL